MADVPRVVETSARFKAKEAVRRAAFLSHHFVRPRRRLPARFRHRIVVANAAVDVERVIQHFLQAVETGLVRQTAEEQSVWYQIIRKECVVQDVLKSVKVKTQSIHIFKGEFMPEVRHDCIGEFCMTNAFKKYF